MTASSFMAAAAAGRYDLYGPIHKGLRRAHSLILVRLGAADFDGDAAPLLADLRRHLALAAVHLTDEEEHIHAALDARAPGGTRTLADQHDHHRAAFAVLEAAARTVEEADAPVRAAAGRHLYLAFSRFVAEDLEHMAEEECETWPLLCARFTDDELRSIEQAIVRGLDPGTNAAFLRHIVPAANHRERAELLGGIKAALPADAYACLVGDLVPDLAPGDRARLAALELMA